MAFPASKKLVSSFLGIRTGMGYRTVNDQVAVLGFDFDFLAFAQACGAGNFERNPNRKVLAPFSDSNS